MNHYRCTNTNTYYSRIELHMLMHSNEEVNANIRHYITTVSALRASLVQKDTFRIKKRVKEVFAKSYHKYVTFVFTAEEM